MRKLDPITAMEMIAPIISRILTIALDEFRLFLHTLQLPLAEQQHVSSIAASFFAYLTQQHGEHFQVAHINEQDVIGFLNADGQSVSHTEMKLVFSYIEQFINTKRQQAFETSQHPSLQSHEFFERLLTRYKDKLLEQKRSPSTVKNYLADLKNFFSFSSGLPLETMFTKEHLTQYTLFLEGKHDLPSTIARKKSSLKDFAKWSKAQGFISRSGFDLPTFLSIPFEILPGLLRKRTERAQTEPKTNRIHKTLAKVGNHPAVRPLAKVYDSYHKHPVTSYLHLGILVVASVIMSFFAFQQFLVETKTTLAYPSSLTPPGRFLSFQARLTDASSTPITSSTNLVFKLWSDPSAGSQLWTSGTCAITPDSNGIFSTLLGSTCGSAIGSNVFTENTAVYLEVTVAAEVLTPRQRIATVAYALNSETLQGFPPADPATTSTIPVVNSSGQIVIAAASPLLQSTSGTFGIKGDALSITTDTSTNGNIAIAPDGTGQVNLTGGTTSTNFLNISNASLTTGTLVTGTVGNNNTGYKFLDFLGGSSPTSKFSVDALGNVIQTGYLHAPGATLSATYSGATPLIINGTGGQIFSIANSGNTVIAGTLAVNGDTITSDSNLSVEATGYVRIGDTGTPGTANADDDLFVSGRLEVDGASIFDSSLTVAGISTFNGNTVIGNANSDTLTINAGTSGTGIAFGDSSFATCTSLETVAGVLTCGTDDGGANYWRIASGALSPVNDTLDVLFGATATTSAKFAFTGMNSARGNQVASISGSIVLDTSTASVQSTNNQGLTLGGTTTGDVIVDNTSEVLDLRTNTLRWSGASNQLIDIGNDLRINGTFKPTEDQSYDLGNSVLAWSGVYTALITSSSGSPLSINSATGIINVGATMNFNGVTNDITTTTNQHLAIAPGGTGNVGIKTTGPDKALEINSSDGNNLRLTYNDADGTATNYTDFLLSSSGDLTITPSGGDVTATIGASDLFAISTGNLKVGNGTPGVTLNGEDAYIEGTLEVDGNVQLDGTSVLATNATTITLGSTGADAITIGNGGADTITIGNVASTGVSITDDNWSITSAGLATFTPSTNSTALTLTGTNVTTGTLASLSSTALTTGKALSVTATNTATTDVAINPLTFTLTNAQGTTANTTSYEGLKVGYIHNTSVATANETIANLSVTANGSATTDTTIASILKLENLDTATGNSITVADALLIQSTTASLITDAIDASDAEIDNAINVGGNFILGDGIRQFSSSSTVWTFEDTSGNDLMTITDNGSDGNVAISGDLAITGGNITTALTADSTLTITNTLTANGNTVIGNANTDTLTINAGSSGTGITFGDSSFTTCTALETVAGVLTCGTDDTGTATNYWRLASGALSPVNDTLDLLIGSTASTSAKFAFLNVNSGTPTASFSGKLVLDSSVADIQSTKNQRLTLGGDTTGDISLMPRNGTGFVGIGTANPTTKLHISDTGSAQLLIAADTDNVTESDLPSILMTSDGSTSRFQIGVEGDAATTFTNSLANTPYLYSTTAANGLQFATNGAARVTINSSGYMGIGTTNPQQPLDVRSTITVRGSGGTGYMDFANDDTTGSFNVGNAGSTAVFALILNGSHILDGASGNVGIGGQTGPDRKLDVLDSTNPQIRLTQADGTVYSELQTASGGNLTINAQSYTRIGDTATPGTATGDDALFVEGGLEVDGASTLDGSLTVAGTSTFNGNTVIGNANTDTLTINAGTSGTGITFADSSFVTCTALETVAGVLTCGSDGGVTNLQTAYDGGNTIETAGGNAVVITETGAGPHTHDLLQLTANASSSTFAGDALQITMDGTAADSFTGNGIHTIIDQSQNTGNPILIEDDGAVDLFRVDETGSTYISSTITMTASTGYVTGQRFEDTANSAYYLDPAATGNSIEVAGSGVFAGDIAINGDDITSDGALTLNATTYTRIGDTATPGTASGDDDLFVEGDIEVNGNLYLDGGNITGPATITLATTTTLTTSLTDFDCTDCIDFDDIADSPSLDSATDINLGANLLSVDLDSTGDFAIRSGTTNFALFEDNSTIDFTFPAAGFLTIDAAATDNTTTAGIIDLDTDTITSGSIGISNNFQVGDTVGNITAYANKTDVTVDTDASQSQTVYGGYIGFTANDATSTTIGLAVINEDASAQLMTTGILIENLQATDIDLTTGLLIRATTTGSLPTAIDVSDAEITTALAFGANDIDGTSFDVAGATGNITTSGDLAVNGDDITADGDLTINPAGGNVIFADTDVLNVGGAAATAYNFFAGATTNNATADADNDLYIEDELEVDGTARFDGAISIAGSVGTGTQCLISTAGTPSWGSCGTVTWDTIGDAAANNTINLAAFTTQFDFTGTTTTAWTFNADSLTSGIAHLISADAVTSGTALSFTTTSTAITTGSTIANGGTATGTLLNLSATGAMTAFTGNLGTIDWSPTSAATSTGDLFHINIGSNGNIGSLLNITDANSTLFKVTESAITSAIPHTFSAAGDVAIAYDLQFTNQTASYIKSNAPLYLQAGESFENNNITMQTYGTGRFLFEPQGTGYFQIESNSTSVDGATATNINVAGAYIKTNDLDTVSLLARNANTGAITMTNVGTAGAQGDPGVLTVEGAGSSTTAYNLITAYNSLTRSDAAAVFRVRADGNVYGEAAFNATGADLAEYFPKEGDIEPGDVVGINPQTALARRYQAGDKLLGVASLKPSFVGNYPSGLTEEEIKARYAIIGFTGQIKVKLSDLESEIKAGDPIRAASETGKATKATKPGYVIGWALENWEPGSGSREVLVYVNPSFADPTLALDNQGQMVADGLAELANNPEAQENKALISSIAYSLSQIIDTTKNSFTSLVAGTINSSQIITDSLSIAGKSLEEFVDARIAQSASTQTLMTNNISEDEQENLMVTIGDKTNETVEKLSIKDSEGTEVASIDEVGNATISGTLTAQKLIVEEIENLENLMQPTLNERINETLASYTPATLSAQLIEDQVDALVTPEVQATLTSLLQDAETWNSASISGEVNFNNLNVGENIVAGNFISSAQAHFTESLIVGSSVIIDENSLSYIGSGSDTFFIQPSRLGNLNLLANLMILDHTGKVQVNGDVNIAGNLSVTEDLMAQRLTPNVYGEDLNIKLASSSGNLTASSSLAFTNELDEKVAEITASGSAKFAKLIIASDNTATDSGTLTGNAGVNASTGVTTLPAGETEITISNNQITAGSLVYITPASSTENKVLYVSAKQEKVGNTNGWFTVSVDTALATDVQFNWWIIN